MRTPDRESAVGVDYIHRYVPYGAGDKVWKCKAERVLAHGPAGTAKAQPLDAIVWTPSGPRTMGSLVVGDQVLTPSGGFARVDAIHEQGEKDIWRLEMDSGVSVECCDEHLWQVDWQTKTRKGRGDRAKLMTTADLRREITGHARGYRRYSVPITKPVAFAARPVKIDPYTLGVLLGDGSLGHKQMSFTTADDEMVEAVRAGIGDKYELRRGGQCGAAYTWRIRVVGWNVGRRRGHAPGYVSICRLTKVPSFIAKQHSRHGNGRHIGMFKTRELAQAAIDRECGTDRIPGERGYFGELDRLGLTNTKSRTKFVPDEYKYNSVEVRLAVLRGLMDTDGTVSREQGNASFCSISKRLAEDVRELIESFGGIVTISEYTAWCNGKNCGIAYRLYVKIDDPSILFSLSRKKALCRNREDPLRRFVRAIVPTERKQCRCIQISDPKALYLTDRFVATHNTLANLAKLDGAARKYPRMRGLIIRKTYSALPEHLKDFEEKILDPSHHVKMLGGDRTHRQRYDYPNGSEIVVGGMNNRDRIMGPSYDMIVVIEGTEFSEEDIETLASRLRNGKMPYQQMIIDCNPREPSNFLWRGANANPAKYVHFPSTHKDNPKYWDQKRNDWTPLGRSYVLGTLANLSGVRRAWFYLGKWQAALGVVYDFDEDTHVIKTHENEDGTRTPLYIPESWRRIRAIDFGLTNPFSCLWIAIDPDGRMYVYRELYMTRRIVEDHARQIVALTGNERIEATIADPEDANGRATLERHGVPTIPAQNAILPGIQKVMARLRKAADGRPRLYLVDNSLVEVDPELDAKKLPIRLRDEFSSYVYPEEKADSKHRAQELPVDKFNHALSALRYAVAYLDGLDDSIKAFSTADMNQIRGSTTAPIYTGDLRWIPGDRKLLVKRRQVPVMWQDGDEGPWNVWIKPEKDDKGLWRPPQNASYSIGASLVYAREGYRGVVCVSRKETMVQVGEAMIENTTPEDFAALLYAAGYWFGGEQTNSQAFVLWEGNTPGTSMGRELIRMGYGWVYFHADTDKRNARPGDRYGWKPSAERAERLLIDTRRMLATRSYTMMSAETAAACERLVIRDNDAGGVGLVDSQDEADDETNVQRARAMALSLSVFGLESCRACNPPKRQAPIGSPAHHEEMVTKAKAGKGDWWNRK